MPTLLVSVALVVIAGNVGGVRATRLLSNSLGWEEVCCTSRLSCLGRLFFSSQGIFLSGLSYANVPLINASELSVNNDTTLREHGVGYKVGEYRSDYGL